MRGTIRCCLIAAGLLQAMTPHAPAAEVTRIVVGFPAGQATDLVARLVAERLGPRIGETVIVENRPGQGGSKALADLAHAAPNGHTLVLAPLASMVVNPHLYASVGYDTREDFAPVSLVADLPLLMVVNPSLPVTTVPELIAYARQNPDKLVHPSSGNGTLSHLGMEDFKRRAGIAILHVPYPGSPPAMTDLMANRVNVAMDTVAVTAPFIKAGKMRLIASAYGERIAAFPDTPTIAEQGFPGFSLAAWIGIVAPAGTPPTRVDLLATNIAAIVQTPEIRQKLANIGALPHPMGPAEFRAFIASEYARWGAVVKTAGLRVN